MKRLAFAIPLALTGCTNATPSAAPDAAPSAVAVAVDASTPPEASALGAQLAAAGVTDDDFARRVLYTWTTHGQIAELAKGAALLTRMESTKAGRSAFDAALDEVIAKAPRDRIARDLRGGKKGLSFRRFAWTSAWPTSVPLGAVAYGDQLLRVVLRPDAILARFEPTASSRWRFVTLDGAAVATAEVEANPQRLTAVFHVHDDGKTHFREYVLCNESMIESWSYGTPEALAELRASAELLAGLAKEPDAGAPYLATLAFPDVPAYAPTAQNALGLERTMRAAVTAQTHPSIDKTVTLKFDGAAVALPPKRPFGGMT